MIRVLLFSIFFGTMLISCMDIDEDVLPVVGIYRAHVVGVSGPFDLIVSTDRGDDVIMESKFDGFDWYTLKADLDNANERVIDIDINNQIISQGTFVKGQGFFRDGTIELRYTIDFSDGEKVNFKLVGTKN
ncbi:MAG: hypothetical protein IPO92_07670 [Saprospiraceae bacterium]|nr:hypothetical protein [Saprospiraceae bacterium]